MPTKDEEASDPAAADHVYSAGTKLLINKTRDVKKFHLVYKENVQYGYCRNLFAMRLLGIAFSLVGLTACLAAGLWNSQSGENKIYSWVCLGVELLFLGWWAFIINAAWVKVPAFAYAHRLLESAENIPKSRKTNSGE